MRSFLITVVSILSLTAGCVTKESCFRGNGKVDKVTRVFMHEPGVYSVLIENPTTGDLTPLALDMGGDFPDVRFRAVVRADVPPGAPMWLNKWAHYIGDSPTGACERLVDIHVHSPAEINGAGWNHGKHGAGETTVVE